MKRIVSIYMGCMVSWALWLYIHGSWAWSICIILIIASTLLFIFWVWECRKAVSSGLSEWTLFSRVPCLLGWHEFHYRKYRLDVTSGIRAHLVRARCCHCGKVMTEFYVMGNSLGFAVVAEHEEMGLFKETGTVGKKCEWAWYRHLIKPLRFLA